MTHSEAIAKLNGRASRKLENNTYLELRGESVAIRLHSTDVVTIHPDGTYTLNSGGWQTVTTKDRINSYSPARLFQKKGEWYLWQRNDTQIVDYLDGMVIDANGIPQTQSAR